MEFSVITKSFHGGTEDTKTRTAKSRTVKPEYSRNLQVDFLLSYVRLVSVLAAVWTLPSEDLIRPPPPILQHLHQLLQPQHHPTAALGILGETSIMPG